MTATSTIDPSSEVRGVPGRRGRFRRRLIAAGALVVLIGCAIVLAVHAVDAAALGRVRVFLDSRSISCRDPADATTVTRGGSGSTGSGDQSYAVPAVRGSTSLDCRLSVVVQNDSDRTLEVDRVTFTLMGPQSAVGLHTDYAVTQSLKPLRGGDPADVVYDWAADPAAYPVDAGGSQRFVFHLISDGCRQAGATTTWDGSPSFTATIGIATADLPLSAPGFGFVGVRTAKQPCR